MLAELNPGESFADYAGRRSEIVRENVQEISRQFAGADAFDVLELMRLREMPLTLTGYDESQSDGLPAAIDLVALTLLARGSRAPQVERVGIREPHEAIENVHKKCAKILRVGAFSALADGEASKYGPLTMLAAQYKSHELNVKFKQYAHLHDHFNAALFGSKGIGDLLLNAAGFTYEDFIATREAIREVYLGKFDGAREVLHEIVADWEENERYAQSREQVERGRAATYDLIIHPGNRASFTVAEIAERADVDEDRLEAVLRTFSKNFDGSLDPVELVEAFLDGQNPFDRIALLVDDEKNYITLNVPIGTDCFRQAMEDLINKTKGKKRYDSHRMRVSEGLATSYLEKLLGTPVAHAGLKYFRPRKGVDVSALSRSATAITSVADQAEADALFLVEDVAVCVEVKGRSVSTRARQGHVQRLASDLKATVGEATTQALRLEALIESNGGLWLEDQTWLDLDHVREIRSIAVCLDDVGPLGTALDELVRAGVITDHRFPWVVSLHDLAVLAEVIDRPAEFLLYLRRRTESDVSVLYCAVDELDMFMLFLKGGLYVQPDPDQVFNEHPTSGEPTAAERKRYRENSIPTRVDTHTDPLDAWVYYQEGSSLEAVDKPSFASNPEVLEIVDFLNDGKKPGWFRFSADLLNLASDAQQRLAHGLREIVKQTRQDHKPHTMLHCYAGAWGFPSLFLGTRPKGMSMRDASAHLATYMIAKKHQLRSDRALGVLIDEEENIIAVRYANTLPVDDDELDQLGMSMGLIPVERMARVVPPSARRRTKRLRGSRKGRKRRS